MVLVPWDSRTEENRRRFHVLFEGRSRPLSALAVFGPAFMPGKAASRRFYLLSFFEGRSRPFSKQGLQPSRFDFDARMIVTSKKWLKHCSSRTPVNGRQFQPEKR
jgi:hypothetical protein